MMDHEHLRNDCLQNILASLIRTSGFRWRKAKQYPDDPRNLRASESLKLMASNATELPDEYWEKLESLYVPESDGWRNALNQATNNVGFSNRSNSFAFFLRSLVELLPTSVAA
jgi:hypothetical protein